MLNHPTMQMTLERTTSQISNDRPRVEQDPLCVLYCRVSSRKQVIEGDGLKSQEKRCRDYAQIKGYKVLEVFTDGVTGSNISRIGINEMLDYLEKMHPVLGREIIVIVDDLKRFARDVETHFDLKVAIYKRGGRLESPLFRFEDTPEGKFIETVVAAQAELERNQNRRQVRNRMQSRLEQGYWTFNLPPGLKYKHDRIHKKMVVFDEPRSDIIREALQRFSTDVLHGQMDVWRYLVAEGFFGPNPKREHLSRQLGMIHRILRQVLYAGYLEHKPWGISLRKAHHAALITFETYQLIQERLESKPRTNFPTGAKAHFPLRGVILCAGCGGTMTGSSSRGRHGARYPYYHCHNRDCDRCGSTIRQEKMEQEFEALLVSIGLTDEELLIIQMRVTEWCTANMNSQETRRKDSGKELKEVQDNIKLIGDRLARTTSEVVAATLEARIEELVRHQSALESIQNSEQRVLTAGDVGTLFEQVKSVLQNPVLHWKNGSIELQKAVTRMVFAEPLRYDRNSGFGTPSLSLPYLIPERYLRSNSSLVDIPYRAWEQVWLLLCNWSGKMTNILE